MDDIGDDWIAGVVDGWLFTSSEPLPQTLLVPLENPHLHDQAVWDRALGRATAQNGVVSWHERAADRAPDRAPDRLAVARPVLGASAVAMLAHAAARRGVTRIVGVGFCGATQPDLQTGDVVVATHAIGADGVSAHYLARYLASTGSEPQDSAAPARIEAGSTLVTALAGLGRTGDVHTVGAVHLETRELVEQCRRAGVLGLDMETAALYAVRTALGVQTVSCLVVTDRPVLELPARGHTIAAAQETLHTGIATNLAAAPPATT